MKAQILLIDDESTVRDALGTVLLRAGYAVWPAPDGHEAMAILNRVNVDLVVTDILMPEQDGIETILKLRRLQPRMPIIAISGGGEILPAQYLHMAKVVGATRLLAKPFEPASLLGLIGEMLAVPAQG